MSDPNIPKRLNTWGEIAGYLDVSVRTAQIWELKESLPVFRNGTRVFAYPEQLEQWLRSREKPPGDIDRGAFPKAPETDVLVGTTAFRSNDFFRRPIMIWSSLIAFCICILVFQLASQAFYRSASRTTPINTEKSIAVNPSTYVPRLFSKATSEFPSLQKIGLPEPFNHVVVTKDGRRAFLAQYTMPQIATLDLSTLEVHLWNAPFPVLSMELSSDGKILFIGGFTDGLALVDTATHKVLSQYPTGGMVSDIAVDTDGKRVFLAMMHRGVKRLTLGNGEWKQLTNEACPSSCTKSPDGGKLIVSYQCGGPTGRDGRDAIEVFDLVSEKSLQVFSGPPIAGGLKPVFYPDSNRVLLSGGDACSRDIYDHTGCPTVPGQVYHLFRFSDSRVLHSFGLRAGYELPMRIFGDGTRTILSQPNEIIVAETARFSAIETFPFSDRNLASDTAVIKDGEILLMTIPASREAWLLTAQPGDCDDLGMGLVHRLSGDGSPNDSIENAQVRPATSYKPGFVGQAFSFDGQSQPLMHLTSYFRFAGSASTLALYVKPLDSKGKTPIIGGGDTEEFWQLSIGKRGLEFQLKGRGSPVVHVLSDQPVPVNQWSQLAVTVSQRDIALYQNGRLTRHYTNDSHDLWLLDGVRQNRLGWGPALPTQYRGLLDELALWNRTLSPSEVMEIYQSRLTGRCSSFSQNH